MKVAIYARCSTDNKGQDPVNQLRELRKFAAQQGWTIVHEYVDHATGKNGDREQFRLMMRDGARRKFECLLFWALDRLTREGIFKTLCYLRQLSDSGVKYRSFTEQYLDTIGIWGEAIAGVLATIAKQEHIRISERTKAGLARVKASGTTLGRPRRDVDVVRVRRLRDKGLSYSAIAKRMKLSRAVVWERIKEAS